LVILIALISLAYAAPADDKKPVADSKPVEGAQNKEPAADEKKPVENSDAKKDDERKGLRWPLPNPVDEGDLMLHGSHLYDRVEELHKGKVEKEEDKMILSVGREYLRHVHDYIKKTPDFKILPDLCRDSVHLNSTTKRWVIRIHPSKQRWSEIFGSSNDGQQEKQPAAQNEQAKVDASQSKSNKQNDPIVPSNSTHENATDAPIEMMNRKDDFEAKREEHYKRVGDNFAHLLLKRYKKEKLEKEEIDYLAHWVGDESIHYGMMSIYCHEGENVEEITKRIGTFIEEK